MDSSPQLEAAPPKKDRRWLHYLLFGLTLASTLYFGFAMSEGFYFGAGGTEGVVPSFPLVAFGAASYCLSIMGILLAHEMGHYLTAKKYGVDATPPFFIPMYTIFGTMGAFIRMRVTEKVRGDHFMKIAAYGPLAGFAVTVPVVFFGLALSSVGPAPVDGGSGMALGDSALFLLFEPIFFSELPAGYDIWLHPMAFAGWAGLFVTAINLIPVGQLDGGHISYCLFGESHNRVVPLVFGGFLAVTFFVFAGWVAICMFVFLMGIKHPPLCTGLPVGGVSRRIGVLTVVVFFLSFTPIPFEGFPSLLEMLAP